MGILLFVKRDARAAVVGGLWVWAVLLLWGATEIYNGEIRIVSTFALTAWLVKIFLVSYFVSVFGRTVAWIMYVRRQFNLPFLGAIKHRPQERTYPDFAADFKKNIVRGKNWKKTPPKDH